MASHARFAEVAALAGDPSRASMLHALMDGRALTAAELAQIGGVTPQTASNHLARMTAAGLLAVEKQGRHRYHRLSSNAVAQMIESIMLVAASRERLLPQPAPRPIEARLKAARTCYDHLAGELGVGIADALIEGGHIEFSIDGGLVTAAGVAWFEGIGIDLRMHDEAVRQSRRVLCRPCLDWSERRHHLAGRLGAALCSHCFESGWIRRVAGTRAVEITPLGGRMFREKVGMRGV